jgi:hypothetical protein
VTVDDLHLSWQISQCRTGIYQCGVSLASLPRLRVKVAKHALHALKLFNALA